MTGEGSGRAPLSAEEAAEFTRQLSGLAATSRSLPAGLRALAEETGNPRLRRALIRVALSVEQGNSLEAALDQDKNAFPETLRGLVQAALSSGRVGEVLAESARIQRVGISLRRRLVLQLSYPVFLLAVFLAAFVFISIYVVRDFEAIYNDFGIQLPMSTIVLLRISKLFQDAGWMLVVGPLVVWMTLFLLGWLAGPKSRNQWIARLPFVGPLWVYTSMAEYCYLLSLLVESRVSLTKALQLAGDATRNADIAWASQITAQEVASGRSLGEAASRSRVYPRGFVRLIQWAEQHRSLSEALRVAGEVFEARARPQAAFIGVFLSVVVVFLVLIGINFIVVALYSPLVQLIGELSG